MAHKRKAASESVRKIKRLCVSIGIHLREALGLSLYRTYSVTPFNRDTVVAELIAIADQDSVEELTETESEGSNRQSDRDGRATA